MLLEVSISALIPFCEFVELTFSLPFNRIPFALPPSRIPPSPLPPLNPHDLLSSLNLAHLRLPLLRPPSPPSVHLPLSLGAQRLPSRVHLHAYVVISGFVGDREEHRSSRDDRRTFTWRSRGEGSHGRTEQQRRGAAERVRWEGSGGRGGGGRRARWRRRGLDQGTGSGLCGGGKGREEVSLDDALFLGSRMRADSRRTLFLSGCRFVNTGLHARTMKNGCFVVV